jgi:hypothetical protein
MRKLLDGVGGLFSYLIIPHIATGLNVPGFLELLSAGDFNTLLEKGNSQVAVDDKDLLKLISTETTKVSHKMIRDKIITKIVAPKRLKLTK